MKAGIRLLPLRVAAVPLALVLTWALAIPALLSLDPFAFRAARQLGAIAAGLAGLATILMARFRLRGGAAPTFRHGSAVDLGITTIAAAVAAWLLGSQDPRLAEAEIFSLFCLQVATGQAAALAQFALARGGPLALKPLPSAQLPSIRRVFTLASVALGIFAAGVLGVGSVGRAAAVREEMQAARLEPLADLIAVAVALHPARRERLLQLVRLQTDARAELRPANQPPAEVALLAPDRGVPEAPDGRLLVLVGGQRQHYVRRRVGTEVLWLWAPANTQVPVEVPEDVTTMLLLALLLAGVPLAALGVGHGLRQTVNEVTHTLLAMGPGGGANAPLGVEVQGDDELSDLAIALNRLCLRSAAESDRLADDLAAAEQAEKARNQFLAAASKALRVPLERISDHISALGRAGPLTNAQQEDVDAIAGASTQLQSHIDEILALSRLEAGRENPLNPTRTSVADLARAVVAASRMNAAPGVTLGISVEPSTPVVDADGPRIRQILDNLVGNALKFTQAGFVEVAVGPAWGDGVHVQVADSGPGIPPEDIDKIFEEFHRVEAHRQVPGTGLGLAISRRLVERHGGRLWAESVPGEGSVFHLRLPARPPQGSRRRPPPAATHPVRRLHNEP